MSSDDPPRPGPRRARPGYSHRVRCGLLSAELWLERGRVAARVGGDLDVFSAGDLGAALTLAQREAPDAAVLFLLHELGFSDSSGLGVFVGAFKRARAAGGAVALVAVPDYLVKTLRITGLAAYLPSFPTFEEAWDWMERRPAPTASRKRLEPGRF